MSYDPKYLGPGYWASWHIKSIYANTQSKKGEVARNIALDIKNFPCLKCQTHAKFYVSRNPLMDAVKSKDPLSMLKWTVDFHNEVNLRLDKKIFTYDEALAMWNGSGFCKENCSEEHEEKREEKDEKREESEEEKKEESSSLQNLGKMLIKNY